MSAIKEPSPIPINQGVRVVRSYYTTETYKINWGRIFFLLFILGLLGCIPVFVYYWFGSDKFWSISKLFVFSIFILFVPTISSIFTKNGIFRTLLDSIVFCIAFLFLVWYLNLQLSLKWYLIAVGIVFVIEWGGFFNRLNANFFMYKLRNKEEQYKELIKGIHQSKLLSSLLYLNIPLSFFIGGLIGIIQNFDTIYSIKIAISIVLVTTAVFIFVLILFNFVKMSSKLIGFSTENHTSFDKVLEIANIVTKGRQVFLYDSLHDIILFVGVVYVGLNIFGIPVSPIMWFFSILLLSFIFNNIPFVIGQRFLHEFALDKYTGLQREKKKLKLIKFSPLFPVPRYLIALTMKGTIGYFLYDFLKVLIISYVFPG